MRVEVVVTVVTADWRVLRAGETHELPDELALSLVRSGVVRAVEVETATALPPETTMLKRKRKEA